MLEINGEMRFGFKSILFYGEKLDILKNLLPRLKNHMLSYPTHFLKIGDRLCWIMIFLRMKCDS